MVIVQICKFICLVFCLVQADIECQLGQCNVLKDCPELLKEVQHGKRPPLCGFQGKEPMVCCFKKESASIESIEQMKTNVRISKQKCAEYGQSVYKIQQAPLIITESENLYVNSTTCPDIHVNFLIRGSKADRKEYPHMALVGTKKGSEIKWSCSGSLISEQYVLTAALCVRRNNIETIFMVRIGELESNSLPNSNDFEVTQVILHTGFKPPEVYNNIALLKLKNSVEFTENIRPACLSDYNQNMTKYYLTGWNDGNKNLLRATTEIMSYDDCRRTLNNSESLPFGISENTQVCALNTEFELCSLDIGSPIQRFNKDVHCMFDIIGLKTLTYIYNCSSQPILYTKISEYIEWIENIVWLQ